MSLTPIQVQAVSSLATALYDFLPATAHPYSKIKTTFGTVAAEMGVGPFWVGGSKEPAIQELLEKTLTLRRERFCALMIKIVNEGIKRKKRGDSPVTREEIAAINNLILQLGFKIPELHDPKFLNTLPSNVPSTASAVQQAPSKVAISPKDLDELKKEFLAITSIAPQQRGYAFERLLNRLFYIYGLAPRSPFKIVGEQIDGSFEFKDQFYLVEAKWQSEPIIQADLLVLNTRVQGHSSIGRGVFITISSFSPDGVTAFQRGRASSIIGIDGQDLFFILQEGLPFDDVLKRKLRHLTETGNFHYPVQMFALELKKEA